MTSSSLRLIQHTTSLEGFEYGATELYSPRLLARRPVRG